MDSTAIIQRHLAEIEETAAQHSANVLKAQDDIIAAQALVDLLKAHGAPEEMSVTVLHLGDTARPLIYPQHAGDDSSTLAAISGAALQITAVTAGYKPEISRLHVQGFDQIELYVKASACQWQVAA